MAIVTGYQSTASVTKPSSIAFAAGEDCRVLTGKQGYFVIVERNENGEILHIKTGKVGDVIENVKIQPDTLYTLVDGVMTEVQLLCSIL